MSGWRWLGKEPSWVGLPGAPGGCLAEEELTEATGMPEGSCGGLCQRTSPPPWRGGGPASGDQTGFSRDNGCRMMPPPPSITPPPLLNTTPWPRGGGANHGQLLPHRRHGGGRRPDPRPLPQGVPCRAGGWQRIMARSVGSHPSKVLKGEECCPCVVPSGCSSVALWIPGPGARRMSVGRGGLQGRRQVGVHGSQGPAHPLPAPRPTNRSPFFIPLSFPIT